MAAQFTVTSLVMTLTMVSVMLVMFTIAWQRENRAVWASYLVSLGIFGTFAGITVALLSFDATSVEESVPDLIAGMQVAFVSSALGLLLSLLLRLPAVMARGEASKGKDADDVYVALREQTAVLQGLKTALIGDGDTTVLTQLKLLRGESRDGFDSVSASLDDFAETLAENNSKAFIAALEGAVREFNEKISEQFGENFKQLNVAVGRLLEWQEQYRMALSEMLIAFREIEERFQEASSHLGEVAQRAGVLAEVSQRQAHWLDAQLVAQTELEARLEAFADLAEQATNAFPAVQQQLREMTEGVSRTVRDTLEAVEGSIEGLESGVEETQKHVVSITERLGAELQASAEAFNQQSLEANARHQERLENSVEELDRMLGEELTKSLNSLGTQLATLSNRFVQDYQPLTESLREVVRLSRGVES